MHDRYIRAWSGRGGPDYDRTLERGSALMLALLALMLITGMGLASLALMDADRGARLRRGDELHAFYFAQAGLERAVGEIYSASTDWTTTPLEPVPLIPWQGGTMHVRSTARSVAAATVEATGTYGDQTVMLTVGLQRTGGRVSVSTWQDSRAWEWPS